jgi:anaerobic ribonucleoside-triphosphate reductase
LPKAFPIWDVCSNTENSDVVVFHTASGDVTIQNSQRTKCEVFERVMGYYRPESEFNVGKSSEVKRRFRYPTSVSV